jgi:uncharacterized NAD-dependent epimerase/dehydratase family protein
VTIFPEGNAIVYCEAAFGTTNGKTAHGLSRRTKRYRILSIIDSTLAGRDAGQVLDGKPNGLPIFSSLAEALNHARQSGFPATHFIMGVAPDGGRLAPEHRKNIMEGIKARLNIVSGLHDFLSEDEEVIHLASHYGIQIRDVRKPPPLKDLHFFSGKIEKVTSFKIAVLGTDSAIGKRTTAWILVESLIEAGIKTELIGTGQTSWMQGVTYGIIMDSLINDFVAGEIEHAVWSAWNEAKPDVIIIEGQGGLLNPAYPGGFEILAAGRPDVLLLQHAPARIEYDGFPGYIIQPLEQQIQALEIVSGKKVIALTINHENIPLHKIPDTCRHIAEQTGHPAIDVLTQGGEKLVDILKPHVQSHREKLMEIQKKVTKLDATKI